MVPMNTSPIVVQYISFEKKKTHTDIYNGMN